MHELSKKETPELLLSDLESSDNEVVLGSIQSLRERGNLSDIPALLDLLLRNRDREVVKAARNLLIDIKTDKANESLIAAIENDKYNPIKKELVSTCWESCLNFSQYLEVFVNILIHDEFFTAFEAFTVIENMTGNISDAEKSRQVEKLELAMANVDENRRNFLQEAVHIVNNISPGKKF